MAQRINILPLAFLLVSAVIYQVDAASPRLRPSRGAVPTAQRLHARQVHGGVLAADALGNTWELGAREEIARTITRDDARLNELCHDQVAAATGPGSPVMLVQRSERNGDPPAAYVQVPPGDDDFEIFAAVSELLNPNPNIMFWLEWPGGGDGYKTLDFTEEGAKQYWPTPCNLVVNRAFLRSQARILQPDGTYSTRDVPIDQPLTYVALVPSNGMTIFAFNLTRGVSGRGGPASSGPTQTANDSDPTSDPIITSGTTRIDFPQTPSESRTVPVVVIVAFVAGVLILVCVAAFVWLCVRKRSRARRKRRDQHIRRPVHKDRMSPAASGKSLGTPSPVFYFPNSTPPFDTRAMKKKELFATAPLNDPNGIFFPTESEAPISVASSNDTFVSRTGSAPPVVPQMRSASLPTSASFQTKCAGEVRAFQQGEESAELYVAMRRAGFSPQALVQSLNRVTQGVSPEKPPHSGPHALSADNDATSAVLPQYVHD